MKKITLLFLALFSVVVLKAQTITQSVVKTAEIRTDTKDVPTSWVTTPSTLTITLDGFAPLTKIVVYNQIRNAAGDQFAGGGVSVTTDATGSGSVNFFPAFFGGGTLTEDETITWNSQAAGATNKVQSFPGKLATLSSKVNTNKLSQSFYNPSKEAIVVGDTVSGKYSIYNITGKTIQQGVVYNEIDVQSLVSGIYILSTESGVLKFIKQ